MIALEASSSSGSREALLRCALELLRDQGFGVHTVSPFTEAPPDAPSGAAALLCSATLDPPRIDDRALDDRQVKETLARALAPLDGAVTMRAAPPGAEVYTSWDAGFATEALEHTADEAFSVTARDRADLLAAAAEALGALIAHPGGVRPSRCLPVDVPAPEPDWPDDDRLFAWLAEVLYTLDKERLALRRAVVFTDGAEGVRGALFGEPLDEERHLVRGGIKAVTYHGLAIEAVPEGLRATVVVDV